jgi:hypothetical protein
LGAEVLGRTDIAISTGRHRVSRPVKIATPAKLQRVEDIIRVDRRVIIDVWRLR